MTTRRILILLALSIAVFATTAAVAQEPSKTPAAEQAPEAATEPTPTVEPESSGEASLTFERSVDFALVKRIALEDRAGAMEFAAVEFTAAASKGGVFGTSDADLKTTVVVMLDCSTTAEKKVKVNLSIEFLDEEGDLIDRVTGSASLKNESKTIELKLVTLKYVVPRIKTAKISAVAK